MSLPWEKQAEQAGADGFNEGLTRAQALIDTARRGRREAIEALAAILDAKTKQQRTNAEKHAARVIHAFHASQSVAKSEVPF